MKICWNGSHFENMDAIFHIQPLQKKVTQHDTTLIDYISFILDFYSSSLISLESLFIFLSIDARVVSLGRMQGE